MKGQQAELLVLSPAGTVRSAKVAPVTERGALFSPCRTWRYRLWRAWGPGARLGVVGLNPSTADEARDDQTMRRVQHYARRWGFDGFDMHNLFATRTKSPAVMTQRRAAGEDVVGPENDQHLVNLGWSGATVLCAWGSVSRPYMRERAGEVEGLLRAAGARLIVLGFNADGTPRHPARLANEIDPVTW